MSTPGFRPAQWGTVDPPLTIIVPGQPGVTTQGVNQTGALPGSPDVSLPGVTLPAAVTLMYVFDGAIRAEHQQRLTITQLPVQTQASVSDNAYLVPAIVTVEIAMSDAMQSYTVGQFSGSTSRSVSAYQTLLSLQNGMTFLQLATRLNMYTNMLIADIAADDTRETEYGLKAIVTFQQVLTAGVEISNSAFIADDSSRPQTTGQTPAGPSQASPPSASLIAQHSINSAPQSASSIPNAGGWSSTNITSLA